MRSLWSSVLHPLALALAVGLVPLGADEAADTQARREHLQARAHELRRELRETERALALLSAPPAGVLASDRPVFSFPRSSRPHVPDSPSSGLDDNVAWRTARLATLTVPGATLHPVAGTGSMRPTLGENSILLTEPAPFSELRVGDIVTYIEPRFGHLVVHRLTERYRDRFIAQGDANEAEDPGYVTADNYRARVYAIVYSERKTEN